MARWYSQSAYRSNSKALRLVDTHLTFLLCFAIDVHFLGPVNYKSSVDKLTGDMEIGVQYVSRKIRGRS